MRSEVFPETTAPMFTIVYGWLPLKNGVDNVHASSKVAPVA